MAKQRQVPRPAAHPGAVLVREVHEIMNDLERIPVESLDRDGVLEQFRQLEILQAQLDQAAVLLLADVVGQAARGTPGFRPT